MTSAITVPQYILLIALEKCKTILFKDQDVGDDEKTYCVRSIAKTVANCPIGDSAQYHVHHIFHHDVHLLKSLGGRKELTSAFGIQLWQSGSDLVGKVSVGRNANFRNLD